MQFVVDSFVRCELRSLPLVPKQHGICLFRLKTISEYLVQILLPENILYESSMDFWWVRYEVCVIVTGHDLALSFEPIYICCGLNPASNISF